MKWRESISLVNPNQTVEETKEKLIRSFYTQDNEIIISFGLAYDLKAFTDSLGITRLMNYEEVVSLLFSNEELI